MSTAYRLSRIERAIAVAIMTAAAAVADSSMRLMRIIMVCGLGRTGRLPAVTRIAEQFSQKNRT